MRGGRETAVGGRGGRRDVERDPSRPEVAEEASAPVAPETKEAGTASARAPWPSKRLPKSKEAPDVRVGRETAVGGRGGRRDVGRDPSRPEAVEEASAPVSLETKEAGTAHAGTGSS